MAWRCTGSTNTELISNLFASHLITSPRVRTAMTAVDRAHYCPHPSSAYEDSPQSIGFGATISAPHMHAAATESLLPFLGDEDKDGQPKESVEGRRVLDVGSGSGYLVHVLANLLGDGGKVVGIDHIQGLVDLARNNMNKSEQGRQLLQSGKVEIVCGDGRKGYAAAGPYDAIHVGAAAVEVHRELVEQLRSPGRMFIPVEDGEGGAKFFGGGQWIWVIDKDEKGKVTKRRDMGVRYVPLTDAPK
jgi:protein-L-isoaspartate(D-aspartate) O-methyltransferase